MNNVTLIGQLIGDPELVYEVDNGDKKLYKMQIKVSKKPYKNGTPQTDDVVNVKAWANTLGDSYDYYDGELLGIEGRIASFSNKDKNGYINEVIASRVTALG